MPLDWDARRRRSANHRWWKYQLLASSEARTIHAPLYAAWLARSWNARHAPLEAVERLELWMLEDVPGPDGRRNRRRVRLDR